MCGRMGTIRSPDQCAGGAYIASYVCVPTVALRPFAPSLDVHRQDGTIRRCRVSLTSAWPVTGRRHQSALLIGVAPMHRGATQHLVSPSEICHWLTAILYTAEMPHTCELPRYGVVGCLDLPSSPLCQTPEPPKGRAKCSNARAGSLFPALAPWSPLPCSLHGRDFAAPTSRQQAGVGKSGSKLHALQSFAARTHRTRICAPSQGTRKPKSRGPCIAGPRYAHAP